MFYTFDIFSHYEDKESPLGYPIQHDEYDFMKNAILHLMDDVKNRFDIVYGCIYKNNQDFEKYSKTLQGISLYSCDFIVDSIYPQYDENKMLRAFVTDIIFNEESSMYIENKEFVCKCKIQPGFYEDKIITLGLILPVRYVYRKN